MVISIISLDPHGIFGSKFTYLFILTLSSHLYAKQRRGFAEHHFGQSRYFSENAYHTVTEYEMSGKPYSQKSGLKNYTNERMFQVITSLWPGNENSYKWANVPGNNQIMTLSIHHIVILPHIILLYVAPFRFTSVLSCCLSTFRSLKSWLWGKFIGIIVLIALSVLGLALQDLLVHCQEMSLDFNTLLIFINYIFRPFVCFSIVKISM